LEKNKNKNKIVSVMSTQRPVKYCQKRVWIKTTGQIFSCAKNIDSTQVEYMIYLYNNNNNKHL